MVGATIKDISDLILFSSPLRSQGDIIGRFPCAIIYSRITVIPTRKDITWSRWLF